MTNEAAERLREWLTLYHGRDEELVADLDAALIAERTAGFSDGLNFGLQTVTDEIAAWTNAIIAEEDS